MAEAEAIWLAAQGLRQAGCDCFRVVLGDGRDGSAANNGRYGSSEQERARSALRRQDLVELDVV